MYQKTFMGYCARFTHGSENASVTKEYEVMKGAKERRTKATVFLTPQQHQLIRKSGKTTQKYFEDLLDLYVAHDMNRWTEGHMYHRQVRVLMARADLIDELCNALPNPYEIGRKTGEAANITSTVVYGIDVKNPSGRQALFKRGTSLNGWGIITEPSLGKFVIEDPPLTNKQFMRGYVEGLLSVKLSEVQVTADHIVFQVEKNQ